MIKKLQKKFIFIAVSSMLIVLFLVLSCINGINFYSMNTKADLLLNLLSENNGRFPEEIAVRGKYNVIIDFEMTEETQFETRYFTVWTNESGAVINTDMTHVAAISENEAVQYTKDILKKRKETGFYKDYKYKILPKSSGNMLIFVDCRSQIETATTFLIVSCLVGVSILLLVIIVISILSRRAIGPMIESFEKQKQFITDAGHEIKTPLAIISANTEVLELTHGKSEWTESIHKQVKRLNELVKNFLTLSRMEETPEEVMFSDIAFDKVVKEEVMPFQVIAEQKGMRFEFEIEKGIHMMGDENSLRLLLSILTDNAVKYGDENGVVRVLLTKQKKSAQLSIYNSCREMPKGNLNRLFDRFYRPETSRARESGGYGIGLSVANSIANVHHGRIKAEPKEEGILFTVAFECVGVKKAM